MEIVSSSVNKLNIEISRDELLIINSALNEICNGIDLFEFETRIGASRENVMRLLQDVGTALDRAS